MGFGSNAVDLGAVIGGMEANGAGFICVQEYSMTDYLLTRFKGRQL